MSEPDTSRLVVVVPVGAAPAEQPRLADLLDSLRHHAADAVAGVYIVNDGNDRHALRRIGQSRGLDLTVLKNPRAGRGDGWLGRLTVGLVHAYRLSRRDHPHTHVLRLDTDALIVRPFAAELRREFAADPAIGLIGSTGLSPTGPVAGDWWHGRLYKMQRPFARWPHAPWFRQNLFGANARLRAHIRRAMARGYRPGESVCGGAMALRADALAALLELPDLRDDDFLLATDLAEDVFASLLVRECGYVLKVHSEPGMLFGVAWRGLPAHDLAAVWARGNAIIHSLKSYGPFTEETSRAFFRAKRAAPAG